VCSSDLFIFRDSTGCPWCASIQTNLKKSQIPHKSKYTLEVVQEIAKDCDTKTQLSLKCIGAYTEALQQGFLNLVKNWIIIGNQVKRCVYGIEFYLNDGNKYIYVGLTYWIEKRFEKHLINGPVHDFIEENKYLITNDIKAKMLTDGYIDAENAQILEGVWLQKYIDEGWNKINQISTGGLGGNYGKTKFYKNNL
jgi:hypothetical protein